MSKTITIIQPDDWHIHLRDNEYLATTVKHASNKFGKILAMPNLIPPIYNVSDVINYQSRINKYLKNKNIAIYFALYFNTGITESLLQQIKDHQEILNFKLYPKGATTNSQYGIKNLTEIYNILELLAKYDIPLAIHGEIPDKNQDIFELEKIFINKYLLDIYQKFPNLRITLEHITTKDAVDFILSANLNIAATITPHHLEYNRNIMFDNGINPHYYCLPILKHRKHQQALINAAISGNSKFFAGTDSAPHPINKKESSCGCAGIYNTPVAIETYTQIFADNNALHNLEKFLALNGAKFYNLPINKHKITLRQQPWRVPKSYQYADTKLIPLQANQILPWQIQ